ncbi:MAG: hypothetical protein CVV27_16890 [Candidatus Melainabacteria bacterium HGW-Melainabacteria-1]|nr:MAG: hypothetical protein CVV27_16890 [Candidatus Melainabacteria bacterium HGW-Melainabacteria-1]
MFRFEWIEHFQALIETGSYQQAATKLGLSVQALRKSIQALEAELGVPLVSSDQQSKVPTLAGQFFLEEAPLVLGVFQQLEHTRKELMVGVTALWESAMASLSEDVFVSQPLQLLGYPACDTDLALLSGEIDIALVLEQARHVELESRLLHRCQMRIVAGQPQQNTWDQLDYLFPARFEPNLSGHPHRTRTWANSYGRRIIAESNHLGLLLELCQRSSAALVLPGCSVSSQIKLGALMPVSSEPPEELSVDFYACWMKRSPKLEQILRLIEALKTCFGGCNANQT